MERMYTLDCNDYALPVVLVNRAKKSEHKPYAYFSPTLGIPLQRQEAGKCYCRATSYKRIFCQGFRYQLQKTVAICLLHNNVRQRRPMNTCERIIISLVVTHPNIDFIRRCLTKVDEPLSHPWPQLPRISQIDRQSKKRTPPKKKIEMLRLPLTHQLQSMHWHRLE